MMSWFKKKLEEKTEYKIITRADEITGERFEDSLRMDMFQSGMTIVGEGQSPWSVIAEYVIHLEKRVKQLERGA